MTHLTFPSRESGREAEKKGPWQGEKIHDPGCFKGILFASTYKLHPEF